jgi:hypothetical protein
MKRIRRDAKPSYKIMNFSGGLTKKLNFTKQVVFARPTAKIRPAHHRKKIFRDAGTLPDADFICS